eukprot:TRINITY_DN12885_c0_g1_i14.p1 TRINITY_DN12885_c0_g1~~TRINITY_DN12885_c0_g1_i14.p1  ORF type:complete len:318 (-),score=57.17 TRINITY_DN12885_c0_g1_i14:893-1801(-)
MCIRDSFDATQIQRLVGSKEESKPQCLILDEIDGAQDGEGRSAIVALCNYIQGKGGSRGRRRRKEDEFKDNSDSGNESEEFAREVGESQKRRKNHMKRPIICICNDLYAKSLAPLRKLAAIFTLKGSDAMRMAEAMKDICTKEKVIVGLDLLTLLCKQSKYDIRSCLNTLQFAAKRTSQDNYRIITKDMLFYKDSNNLISSKDCFQGIYEVWDEILKVNPEKGRTSVRYIRDIVQKSDNSSFILDGLYCNALNNSINDLNSIATFMVTSSSPLGLPGTLQHTRNNSLFNTALCTLIKRLRNL